MLKIQNPVQSGHILNNNFIKKYKLQICRLFIILLSDAIRC
jgi:hypothetical protein